MRICQINPGLLSIPPKNWGAIEKIIWNYLIQFKKLGHSVDIKYPNEIKQGQYDIVHSHTWNQTIEIANKNIPVVNSLHDHHVVLWGQNSLCYKQNKEAIGKSIITIVPGEFLIQHFNNPYKLFYLSHGVDTTYFCPSPRLFDRSSCSLLCVANNGYIDNPSYDRKGFRIAIEAARQLELPITIVGPTKNNKVFFDNNSDLLEYEKLEIKYDLDEYELLKEYQSHDIFLHMSELEAGHPNLTILEALSCGLPVIGTSLASEDLEGFERISKDKNELINKIKLILNNYQNFSQKARKTAQNLDYSKTTAKLLNIYGSIIDVKQSFDSKKFKNSLIKEYKYTDKKQPSLIKIPTDKVKINFNEGAFCEITGKSNNKYSIEFKDNKHNKTIYKVILNSNSWARTNYKYFVDYKILIKDSEGNIVVDQNIDLNNKSVFIQLDSKALGDTIAWFPYVEEFRKKHNCRIICCTFWNKLFKDQYPSIEFVEPGSSFRSCHASYIIGLFDPSDISRHPIDYRLIPLQRAASDQLGLKYQEIAPKISIPSTERKIQEKYVCISGTSTAQAKLWNNPGAWQKLIDYLNENQFKVVLIQKEWTDLKNVIIPENKDISESINYLVNCEFFIGLSSGISWLAWALGKKVALISGFTAPWYEFKCLRIHNGNCCNSCWNDINYRFDPGDWNWCPRLKNTPGQFECSKIITAENVIDLLKAEKFI